MNNPHEFVPGVILPVSFHGVLRKRLTEISVAIGVGNCLIAQARAEGLVEGLELLKALELQQIERLYLVIEQTATARLDELQRERGA